MDEEINEIEESEEDNEDYYDEHDVESIRRLDDKQKELQTSVVDYNLETLSSLINKKVISLTPGFQRRFRWSETKQSQLIESFLMNVPVPPLYLNEDGYGKYSVIDGKQRLSAIHNFFKGTLILKGLEIFTELNGKNFDNLPLSFKSSLQAKANLRAVIILKQSDVGIKYEVFKRLNTGGAPLTAQEIRNSAAPSKFNNLLIELSQNPKFHKLLGIKNKEKSKTYRTMRDVEFILRYFTFRDNWQNISGKLKKSMDKFMEDNRTTSKEEIEDMRIDFLNTLDVVEACFGDNAFKRYLPAKNQWRQLVLASLYDAQMFSCRGFDISSIGSRRDEIEREYKKLFLNKDFRNAIDAATNTPTYFTRRISDVKTVLENAGAH